MVNLVLLTNTHQVNGNIVLNNLTIKLSLNVAEGTPVANMMDFILNNLKREELPENTTEETNLRTNIQPVHLPFSINQELSDGIAGAKENLDK